MSQDYRSLRNQWYDLLAETGFNDIEERNSPREMLKKWDHLWFQSNYPIKVFLEKQRYFQMAESFLSRHKFSSKQEKIIWHYHSKGLSCREIANKIGLNKDKINQTIRNLIHHMRHGID